MISFFPTPLIKLRSLEHSFVFFTKTSWIADLVRIAIVDCQIGVISALFKSGASNTSLSVTLAYSMVFLEVGARRETEGSNMRLSHRALMSGLTGKFKWGRRSRNAKMVRYKRTERGDCSSGAASGTKGGEKSLHRGDWASQHGYGYRCDTREVRDVKWDGQTRAVAAEWDGEPMEHQVHREMAALLPTLQREATRLRGRAVLLMTDCTAVVRYVNEGAGSSEVMTAMAKEMWAFCSKNGISMRAEHMAGARMIAAGVDSCSRASEFTLARQEYTRLNTSVRWGRRWGFAGFTVDLCASQKTKKCKKYYSRGGEGRGSLGDVRTALLDPCELYYVVPPIGMIEAVIQLLEEARVAAVLVVPLWAGREWNLYLRERGEDVAVLPWRSYPAVWLDVSEAPKEHVIAGKWEFMVVAVDWRQGAVVRQEPLPAPQRWTDKQDKESFKATTRRRWQGSDKPGGQGYPRRGSRGTRVWRRPGWHRVQRPVRQVQREYVVLSLCAGMGTEAVALQRVFDVFGINMKVRVLAVEFWEWARRIAKAVAGDKVQHVEPFDLWDWVSDEAKLQKKLEQLGEVHATVMGYSCQDVSTAFKSGKGLLGPKSSVFFAGRMIVDMLRKKWPRLVRVFECTWFENKHPRDWKLVERLLGTPAQCLEAARVAPARRKRAIWADAEILPLQRQEEVAGPGQRDVGAASCLEGDRRPAHKWVEKMPTVMSSGPRSWNMKRCVAVKEKGRWRLTNMLITEAEVAMGWRRNATQYVDGDVEVPEHERWRAVGNAIQLGVMAHIWVSVLVTQGYITRDDVRQKGQTWTVDQDGPKRLKAVAAELQRVIDDALGEAAKAAQRKKREVLQSSKRGPKAACQEGQAGKGMVQRDVQVRQQKRKQERSDSPTQAKKSRALIRQRWGHGDSKQGGSVVRMRDVYAQVDAKGVPALRHMTREVERVEPKSTKPKSREQHRAMLRQVVVDGMVLSKSEKTWQSYAVWWAVFVTYCTMEGVQQWSENSSDVEEQVATLQLALADLFYHGQYAVKSLRLMATAVCTRIRDATKVNVREQYPELGAQLEGYEKKEGRATRKKQPTTEEDVRLFMSATAGPWTGSHASLKWVQWTAIVCAAWQAFLRKQEIRHMQLCDVVWSEAGAVMTIRKTKNDTKSTTRSVSLVFDKDGGEHCMLGFIRDYVMEMHGSTQPKEGCTKEKRPAQRCRA